MTLTLHDIKVWNTGLYHSLRLLFVDFFVEGNDDLTRHRIANVLAGKPAKEALFQGLNDFSAFEEGTHQDTIRRAAILLGHDDVLGDVDQSTRQIT